MGSEFHKGVFGGGMAARPRPARTRPILSGEWIRGADGRLSLQPPDRETPTRRADRLARENALLRSELALAMAAESRAVDAGLRLAERVIAALNDGALVFNEEKCGE